MVNPGSIPGTAQSNGISQLGAEMYVDDYGSRKCKICGCFLPKFTMNECACTKCGAYYQSEWNLSR